MMIYHRTKKQAANKIAANGFRLKPTKNRVECGSGVYAFSKLEDANSPYAKKTYGNYVIAIELHSVEWVKTTKLDAMNETKSGIVSNFSYNVEYLGDVVVLNDLSRINKISVSKDNGRTWNKIIFYK